MTSQGIAKILTLISFALPISACMPLVSEIKEARSHNEAALHERLSRAIHANGFSHGVRSVHGDVRQIDVIVVEIPLDSLKRQFISLHHMLFDVARLCARPEYANLSIEIELNAGDESDREYMRKLVEPILSEARNVQLISKSDSNNDLIVTITFDPNKPKAK